MNVFKRNAVFGPALVLAGILSACSSGADPGVEPSSENSQSPSSGDSGSTISAPKDASAKELCVLLPPEAAASLGVEARGDRESSGIIDSSLPDRCVWKSADGDSVRFSFSVMDRSLEEYYSSSDTYADFEKLNVAGHPAVRANESNPAEDGVCGMFLAAKDGQLVAAITQLGRGSVSETDPCDLSRKALESAVPTWPSAK